MVAGGGFNASCYNLSEFCYGRTPTLEGTIKSFEHGVMFTGGAMVVSKFIPPALGKVNDFLKGPSHATDTPAIELVNKTGEGIPLEEVRSEVLKQIHPDENGAYGYVANEGTA